MSAIQQFPLVIPLEERWQGFAFVGMLVALAGILNFIFVILWHDRALDLFELACAILFVLTLPSSLAIPPYPETQWVVATEEGMKVNDISTIPWNDTRLFALIGPRRRNPSVIFYELADAEESLVFRVRTKPFP